MVVPIPLKYPKEGKEELLKAPEPSDMSKKRLVGSLCPPLLDSWYGEWLLVYC